MARAVEPIMRRMGVRGYQEENGMLIKTRTAMWRVREYTGCVRGTGRGGRPYPRFFFFI